MNPKKVLVQFNITGVNLTRLTNGIINHSWKVANKDGFFLLQKVSSIFSPRINHNYLAVSSFLKEKKVFLPKLFTTVSGVNYIPDRKGFWRLFEYVEGTVFDKVVEPSIAYQAGLLLGKYHYLLNQKTFCYRFKDLRKAKHNIPFLRRRFFAAEKHFSKKLKSEFVFMGKALQSEDLPAGLRHCVYHGDPKISNFIFGGKAATQAATMVDWDDCGNNANILYELGSAFRSWSEVLRGNMITFDLKLFRSGLAGYFHGSGDFLQKGERKLLFQAIKIQILQGIARYLVDYRENSYYLWDESKFFSRREHNLHRARSHVALYMDVLRKENEIRKIINNLQ